jgi:hypothetical protein
MHTITNRSIQFAGIALAAFVLALMPLMAPKAHAADLFGGSDWVDTGYYDYSYPESYDYGNDNYDYGYSQPYDYGCSSCSTPSYSYSQPYDYGCSSCSTSYPSYSYGCSSCTAYSYPSSYGYNPCYSCAAPITTPVFTPPANNTYNLPTDIYSPITDSGNTYTNIPTTVTNTTDTCTGNSCNTTISTPINAPTTVTITNPNNYAAQPVYQPVYQPTPIYNAPVQQPYYSAPVSYNAPHPAPYVSLKSVPYTGLDLGPVGTALYWGFLALWALFAAYLVAVKRAHVGLVNKLFGKKAAKTTAHVAPATHAPVVKTEKVEAPATSKFGNIDPFIASQLSKIA